VRGDVFEKLSGLWIPSEIMRISELTANQKMITAMALSFRDGLRMSNNDLSTLLGIDRRNVIYNIQRLRKKGYLIDAGPDEQHRVLKANGDKLALLSSGDLSRGSDVNITTGSDASITSLPQSSDASITHKQRVNKYKNKRERRFTPPTVEEVRQYALSIKYDSLSAEHFIDYYSARGWQYRRGQPVKDWRAAVRTWRRRDSEKGKFNGKEFRSVGSHRTILGVEVEGKFNGAAKNNHRKLEYQPDGIGEVVKV
jgi:biotin operon repressor